MRAEKLVENIESKGGYLPLETESGRGRGRGEGERVCVRERERIERENALSNPLPNTHTFNKQNNTSCFYHSYLFFLVLISSTIEF